MIILMALSFGTVSQAGLLIEPIVGYYTGDNEEDAATGMIYGARIGYEFARFFVAGDYSTGTVQSALTGVTSEEQDFDITRTALVVGFDPPGLPLRLWFGVIMSASLELQETTLAGQSFSAEFNGTGSKLGVGLTFLPIVDINLEYVSITHDDNSYKLNGTKSSLSEASETAIVLSLSAPFTF